MSAVGGRMVLVDLHVIGYLPVLCTLARRPGCDVKFPDHAGHGIRRLEEDLAMSDRIPEAEDADDQRGSEPDMSATNEFARMRAVMRASEKHREGGVDPELEVADPDPGPNLVVLAVNSPGSEPGTAASGGGRSGLLDLG